MRRQILISAMVGSLLPLATMTVRAQSQAILPDQIWIFDNDKKPVQYEQLSQLHPIQHFNLDQTKTFEQQFSLGLSGSSSVATKQALQRIQNLTPSQMEQFKHSYKGIVTAFQMGVRQLPAVVFDYKGQQFVVYGQQQASKALQEFQQWHQKH